MQIERFSFGMGDRFAQQGEAQLSAILEARARGLDVVPVWNKSFREHSIVGSQPDGLRAEADAAVQALGYEGNYYVDADHINLETVDGFIAGSNFFTIDVADAIGTAADPSATEAFLASHRDYLGQLTIPGIEREITVREEDLQSVADRFLGAVQLAGRIYRHIAERKGADQLVTEVSMDETDVPQGPVELFFILSALAGEGVPVQTIAPKFSGRFNKGVDYVGDPAQFAREFDEDLCVVAEAVKRFGLPANLKLSVHSGSDKFSIYEPIRELVQKRGAGLHVKTAGTTWLEEVIGLAEAGGDGLALAKEIYAQAYEKREALCAPYATVIDIDAGALPAPAEVAGWDSEQYCAALRHEPGEARYNQHLRQLLHVGFKVAAGLGDRYLEALKANREVVSRNVKYNLLERHISKLIPSD